MDSYHPHGLLDRASIHAFFRAGVLTRQEPGPVLAPGSPMCFGLLIIKTVVTSTIIVVKKHVDRVAVGEGFGVVQLPGGEGFAISMITLLSQLTHVPADAIERAESIYFLWLRCDLSPKYRRIHRVRYNSCAPLELAASRAISEIFVELIRVYGR